MTIKRLREYLLAILIGNVIYFALSPHLPPGLGAAASHLGWGTLLDFVICVAVYRLFLLGVSVLRRVRR